jgi:hypothetical protein
LPFLSHLLTIADENVVTMGRASLIAIAALIGGAAYLLFFWPLRDPHPAVPAAHGALAVREAKIHVSPEAPPIEHGTVLVRDGAIAAVGPDVAVPPDAQVLP